MPITTVNPTVNTTPDIGGDTSESGISNTGHTDISTSAIASSVDSDGGMTEDEARSGRWSSFSAVPGGLISLRLKFNWASSGNVSVLRSGTGFGAASITYKIEYTIDGGSNWLPAVTKSLSVSTNQSNSFSDGASFSVDLSNTQNVALVEVRDRSTAHATASAGPSSSVDSNALVVSNINTIRLEAETPAGNVTYKCLVGS